MNFRSLASSSAGNCNQVSAGFGADRLMLDCGVPAKKLIRKGINLSAYSGCLITHEHKDHCKAVRALQKRAVDCFMLQETAEALGIEKHHRTRIIRPSETIEIGAFKVVPFWVPHDVPCAGFLIEAGDNRMAYITDCAYCPATFPALDIIAIEINHDKETLYDSEANFSRKRRTRLNHMGLTAALKMIREAASPRLKEIHVLHMSNETADEKKILSAVQAVAGCSIYICEE